MKKKRLVILIPVIIILSSLIYGVYWITDYYKPSEEAITVFNDITSVDITKDDFITIEPKSTSPSTGLIFYPGGKVAPEAYMPLAAKIANNGYKVVIVPMPLNLAVLKVDKANEVIHRFPDIKNWAIGGHSLGGIMAASFAHDNLNKIKGLIMIAAYPQAKDKLDTSNIKVLSIYGTLDGCADLSKIINSATLLPKDAEFKAIEGGNHAQFGSYGFQKGDNKASITDLEQQALTVQYTVSLLDQISK
jgi:dienelactone hydrolase